MPEAVEKHLMLDLETLGLHTRSVVLEIGAVAFDPYGPLLGEFDERGTFYKPIDIDSCLKLGLEIDGKTLLWWMGLDEENRQRQVNASRITIGYAAEALRKYCEEHTVTSVWSHGSGFDCALMESIYHMLHKAVPWDFRKVKDTRTLFGVTDLTEEKWKFLMRRPYKHHPVCDAWAQARAVQYCLTGEDDDTSPAQAAVGEGAVAA